ncbi:MULTISPECIES: DNA topoisomerase IV [Flavobacterium]|jgi:hypothetical protein|uniref:DNA topoisomerase IV n=1 Tax=Flavobacterium jumunjinense TaxID=998845 RepID=A0ABV5GHT9_9FLAO|nr:MULTISPECIES: DNA topoisomerase IV [Flavobacterium]
MSKKIVLLLPFVLASCYNQKRNCKDFKTGSFEFTQEIEGKNETSYFERNDSLQIETFRGQTDTLAIRWINDCEYIGKNIRPKNMAEKKSVHIKILTTNEEGYTFEYSYVGESKKQRGFVTKKQ